MSPTVLKALTTAGSVGTGALLTLVADIMSKGGDITEITPLALLFVGLTMLGSFFRDLSAQKAPPPTK